MSQLERPLLDQEDFVSEHTELYVSVVPFVLHDGILSEVCIHGEISVTEEYHGDVLIHDDTHGLLELTWELLLEVCTSLQEDLHE